MLWSPTPLRYAGGACRQGKSASQPPMAGISPYSICQQLPTKTGRNKARSSKSVTTFAVVYTGSSSWATLCIAELRVAPFDHCDKVCDFSVIFAPSTYACCRNLSEQFGRHEANTSNLRSAPKSTEIHFWRSRKVRNAWGHRVSSTKRIDCFNRPSVIDDDGSDNTWLADVVAMYGKSTRAVYLAVYSHEPHLATAVQERLLAAHEDHPPLSLIHI